MEISQYVNQMQNIAQANNAWSAQQAQKQMDFQKMMSDTAHQREVEDLKAAGLNPVLSAGGSGAASASGAMGETDQSAAGAIGSLFQTVLSTDNARAIAEMNNSAAMLRQKESDSAAMDRLLIQMQAKGALSGSGSSSGSYSPGSYSPVSNPSYVGENFVLWTDGYIDSLPKNGKTLGIPNSVLKYAWYSLGRDAVVSILQNPNAQQILVSMFPNVLDPSSASDVVRDDDPQKTHPDYSMQSLGTLSDKYDIARKKLDEKWSWAQASKVNKMAVEYQKALAKVKKQLKN